MLQPTELPAKAVPHFQESLSRSCQSHVPNKNGILAAPNLFTMENFGLSSCCCNYRSFENYLPFLGFKIFFPFAPLQLSYRPGEDFIVIILRHNSLSSLVWFFNLRCHQCRKFSRQVPLKTAFPFISYLLRR